MATRLKSAGTESQGPPSPAQRQMDTWHKDPFWVDSPPKIEVQVPEDAFLRLTSDCVLGLPPDQVFDILCDPENRRVFKNIKGVIFRKVLEDDGARQVVELEQLASWRFLFLSGTFSVRLNVVQDRRDYTMRFRLTQPGFMKHFQGSWRLQPLPVPPSHQCQCPPGSKSPSSVAPALGSALSSQPWGLVQGQAWTANAAAEAPPQVFKAGPAVPWYGPGTRIATVARIFQEVSPAVTPPPFLAHYLRGISANTTLEVLRDFQTEATRLRYGLAESSNVRREMRKLEREQEKEALDERPKERKRQHGRRRGQHGGRLLSGMYRGY